MRRRRSFAGRSIRISRTCRADRLRAENTVNVGKQSTSGIDVDATYRFPSTSWGRTTIKYNGAYVMSWKQQTFDSTGLS
jgi:hypothetical protein